MSCTRPIKAFKDASGVHFNVGQIYNIELPCGMCIGCRMRRAQDWKIRCMHEASLWGSNNCFVTLTYATNKLPPNASLCKADFQKFMKRLRYHRGANQITPIRYYMCGEYGPLNGRPHYHANLFNVNFLNRTHAGTSKSGEPYYTDPELTEIWGHGRATVQDLTPETAGYTTGYIMKKLLGQRAEEYGDRTPEYGDMSRKPGIGEQWFQKYYSDITRHDIAIMNGREHQVPKYYDKLAIRAGHVDKEQLKSQRADKAALMDPQERTPERRKVREQVQIARLRNHERSNDL